MDVIKKHREFLVYCLFGFLASLLNIAIFDVAHNNFNMQLWLANTLAWFISNTFSFFVTKMYVFKTEMKDYSKMFHEGIFFLLSRLFSLLFDDVFMIVAVLALPVNNLIIKAIDQVLVGILNYFTSKLIFNYNNRRLRERIKQLRARRN
ncbi:GtrA family protein [Companilactobacillus mishanensis]|uniref:GtrA family protein n=1 Tax=Companilactobacillus mishanensis TaxID=2486008 RepID=A0A5P0ZFF8_9LACO|nr:GtrA family protein [Companilactobacillus mishanensis]MQS51801.1 GtrA family protein [Companilactobacillus mishanensis]